MSDSPGAERRARATVRRFSSAADADRDEAAYWRGIPEAERVLEVWRLSQEQWALAGPSPDEPGFLDLLRAFADAEVRFLVVGAFRQGG